MQHCSCSVQGKIAPGQCLGQTIVVIVHYYGMGGAPTGAAFVEKAKALTRKNLWSVIFALSFFPRTEVGQAQSSAKTSTPSDNNSNVLV